MDQNDMWGTQELIVFAYFTDFTEGGFILMFLFLWHWCTYLFSIACMNALKSWNGVPLPHIPSLDMYAMLRGSDAPEIKQNNTMLTTSCKYQENKICPRVEGVSSVGMHISGVHPSSKVFTNTTTLPTHTPYLTCGTAVHHSCFRELPL